MRQVELLSKAFESFNEASIRLSDSYEVLQRKVEELNLELEKKNRELEENMNKMKKLEEQARRQDRLAAMGEMAAKVAHEIRNPLGSIELFASILRRELRDDKPNLEIAEYISEGVKNLDNVITNLLMFTKFPEPKSQKFDLDRFLKEAVDFTNNIISQHGIVLKREYYGGSKMGYGDKELLKQAFLNLILNAIQSMPDGGTLTVSTGKKERNGDDALRNNTGDIVISISDTGVGIAEDEKDKIFDPFYTTKDSGTGLGLTIAHNIITAHGGNIEVDSRKGKGTTFLVILHGRD